MWAYRTSKYVENVEILPGKFVIPKKYFFIWCFNQSALQHTTAHICMYIHVVWCTFACDLKSAVSYCNCIVWMSDVCCFLGILCAFLWCLLCVFILPTINCPQFAYDGCVGKSAEIFKILGNKKGQLLDSFRLRNLPYLRCNFWYAMHIHRTHTHNTHHSTHKAYNTHNTMHHPIPQTHTHKYYIIAHRTHTNTTPHEYYA